MRPKFVPEMLPGGCHFKSTLLNPRGARAITVVTLVNKFNDVLSIGHAICNPIDTFNAERGVLIAEGRALKAWWMRSNQKVPHT